MNLFVLTFVLTFVSTQAYKPFKCPSDGLFPQPEFCEVFYNCGNGVATRQICPEGLVFNTKKKVCDYPKDVDDCQEASVEGELYQRCHPLGTKGCKTYAGPDDVKCCGDHTACYNFGGSGHSGGYNQCVKTRS